MFTITVNPREGEYWDPPFPSRFDSGDQAVEGAVLIQDVGCSGYKGLGFEV